MTSHNRQRRRKQFLQWNCNGFSSSSASHTAAAALLTSTQPLVLALCETHLTSPINPETTPSGLKIPSYNFIAPSPPINTTIPGRGGIAFYIAHHIPYEPLLSSHPLCTNTVSQVVWVLIKLPQPFIIGCIYLHSAATTADLSNISSSFVTIQSQHPSLPILVMGDVNSQHEDWGCPIRTGHHQFVSDLVSTSSLIHLNALFTVGQVTRPGQGPQNQGSIIDIAVCNSIASTMIDTMIIDPGIPLTSDHTPLIINLNTMNGDNRQSALKHWKVPSHPRDDIAKVNASITHDRYSTTLTTLLSGWLGTWNLSNLLSAATISLATDDLNDLIVDAALSSYGLDTSRNNPQYWFKDPQVQHSINRYHEACKQYRITGSVNDASLRTQARNHRDMIIRKVKQEGWEAFCNSFEDVQKSIVWSTWNRVKGSSSNSLSNVKDANGILPSSTTDALNNVAAYYASVTDSRTVAGDNDTDQLVNSTINPTSLSYPASVPNIITDTPWTLQDVISACVHIRQKTSMGTDHIHPAFIKHGGTPLHQCLVILFNAIWNTGHVPDAWREANVCSLYKKGSRTDPSNYRPISLTSVMARMFERMVCPRLVNQLSPSLCNTQFGFRKERCTYDNIQLLQERVFTVLNANRSSRLPVAFLDLAKAFDKVDHKSLLCKLSQLNVTGKMWNFIRGFLSNRRFRTLEQDQVSNWYPIHSGVPQGTVLGPILFLAYINDLATDIEQSNCTPLLFADDLAIIPKFSCDINTSVGDDQLQRALTICTKWAFKWKMKFGSAKSNVLMFQNRKHPSSAANPFQLCGFEMDFVTSYTYVGLTFDQQCSWKDHYKALTGKLARASAIVSRLISGATEISPHAVAVLLRVVTVPTIAYALPFWSPSKSAFKRLNAAMVRPLRSILKLPYSTHTMSLLSEFGIPSAECLHEYMTLTTAHRFALLSPSHPVSQSFPSLFRAPLVQRHTTQPLPTRASVLLRSRHWGQHNNPLTTLSQPTFKEDMKRHVLHRATSHWDNNITNNTNHPTAIPSLSGCKWLRQHANLQNDPRSQSSHIMSQTYLSYPFAFLRARFRFHRARTKQTSFHVYKSVPDDKCDHPSCRAINIVETIDHLLLDCPAHHSARVRLRQQLASRSCNITSPLSTPLILGWIPPAVLSSKTQVSCLLHCTATFLRTLLRNGRQF